MIYKMAGPGNNDDDWLHWINGAPINIQVQSFNTNHTANCPFVADWREHDGHFYIIYAGRTEGLSHARRGNNKLGLARSKNLINWEVANETQKMDKVYQ